MYQPIPSSYGSRTLLACLLLVCVAGRTSANEDPPGGYYASVSAEVDEEDSSNLTAGLGLPLGERGWLHLGAGTSETNLDVVDVDTTFASIGAGLDTDRVRVSGSYAFRKDSDSFEQHDLSGSITVLMTRGTIGLDLFHRAAEGETVTSIERRRRDPLAILIQESIEGTGLGAHGSFHITETLSVFAAGMAYDYDSDMEGPAYLSRFPRLNLHVSGVTREEAYFDNTLRAGLTYDLAGLLLTGMYLRDEAFTDSEITNTLELSANILVGDAWSVATWVGQSSNDTDGDILFGGIEISVIW